MGKDLFYFFSCFWIINSYESHVISRGDMSSIRTDRDDSDLLICACWILFSNFFTFSLGLLSDVFEVIELIGSVDHFFKLLAINVSFDFLFEFWILKIIIMPDSNRLIAWTCGKSENILVWIRHDFQIINRPIMSKKSSTYLDLLSVFHVPNQSHFIRIKDNKFVSFNVKSCSKRISIQSVISCLNFDFLFSNLPVDFSKRRRFWKCV